jgi:hypothetical protein
MKFAKIILPTLLLTVTPGVAFAGIQGGGDLGSLSSADHGPDRCLMQFPNNPLAWQYWNCNVGFAD